LLLRGAQLGQLLLQPAVLLGQGLAAPLEHLAVDFSLLQFRSEKKRGKSDRGAAETVGLVLGSKWGRA
jgi:hypothetical protein